MQVKSNHLSKWKIESIGDLISLEYGRGLTESKRRGNKFPVFGSNGIVGYHDEFLVEGPGIIVGRKGSIGEIVWSEPNFWTIDTAYYVKKKTEIVLKWMYYFLVFLNLKLLNSATGIPGLNRNDVYNLSFPVPPLDEQQKIASILSHIDNLIQKTDQVIEQTQRLKKGLMQRLLTKGIGHTKFKKTELGEIPEEWQLLKISDITTHVTYGITVRPKFHDEGIPLISAREIRNGSIDYKSAPKISKEDYNKLSNKEIGKIDDVFYSKTGTIGLVARAKLDTTFAITQNIASLRPNKEKIDPGYLEFVLKTPYFYYSAIKTIGTTTIPDLQLGEIKKIKVPVTSMHEQRKITTIVQRMDDLIQKLKDKKKSEETLKKGLMQQLLTGKIRVKV